MDNDYIIKKIMELIEMAKHPPLPPTMTMNKCLEVLNEIREMGTFYAENEHDKEKAFMLYLRFVSIVVEELPWHQNFGILPLAERKALDARLFETMLKANELKRCIWLKYEQEQQQKLQNVDQIVPSTSSSSSNNQVTQLNTEQLLLEHQQQMLSPYVQCQCVSVQPIMFKRLIIPNNIPELFLTQHSLLCPNPTTSTGSSSSTAQQPPFHLAILYGSLIKENLVVSQLTPCPIDSIKRRNFLELYGFFKEPDTGEKMPIVGCICTSLEMASNVGFFRHSHITEMVFIVCTPGPRNTRVLHLVNMSPNGGSACTTPAAATTCAHLLITEKKNAKMTKNVVVPTTTKVPKIVLPIKTARQSAAAVAEEVSSSVFEEKTTATN